ncbi:signal peptidase I [Buchnera aphidicola str. APS (Acyrthosiphon pisum)]|uniref:Signal peptidase I n=2 Tax=Buchnera aphidicola TaxID=9 RepID=LEP_BUCAI|nr:signal peptidase I [Buchnera aphidicola]P57347.1 RecName: Full=Signal peptidase I; Short=SPase I; AltName: Full=Leader peptidase I [Buchnera aphidicola str. APS (Acyrthosiphon pisum)]pir/A84960/ probable signal peptidase I (EC 3.4.21.89) BU259 [similarity] - Buchnera sp. (strain APS) [Buchnera sp. (in: enterobacteria)]ADP66653.1 signal peptidase I [Buchnera aphidicola str. TLW03 (Acyrthosiphon pisum)]OQX99751.1 MAG: S26 family signal peptidase [Erwiniaceae bacterium 4572_131]ACL30071.1 sign
MANILTIFLLISTLVTGIFWSFYCIKSFKNYLINKKIINNNNFHQEKIEKSKNKTYFLKSLASFFPIFLAIFIIRSFIYEPFQIPSGSMMPTLLVGDFILVEKFSYGIKEPITHKILIRTKKPNRGDIAVFQHPTDHNINYIKRIIGLPGDKIRYDLHDKHIHICTNYSDQRGCEKKISINYSQSRSSNFIQKIYFSNKNNIKEDKNIYNSLYFDIVEEIIEDVKHSILLLNSIKNTKENYFQQKNMPKLTWIVPKGEYFMMGDNRDNSLDSRYWGFVPEKNLVGKAIKIWMSFDKNENEWPTGIRINRIGSIH